MTKPINIYLQSRINEELSFNRVEKHSSGKIEICRTHEHEIKSLKYIVDAQQAFISAHPAVWPEADADRPAVNPER